MTIIILSRTFDRLNIMPFGTNNMYKYIWPWGLMAEHSDPVQRSMVYFLLLIRGKAIIQNIFTTRGKCFVLLRRLRGYFWTELQWNYCKCQVRVNHRSQLEELEVSNTCSWHVESKWTPIWQEKCDCMWKTYIYRHTSEYIHSVHVYKLFMCISLCSCIMFAWLIWILTVEFHLFYTVCHITTFLVPDEKYGSSSRRGGLLVYSNWVVGPLSIILPSYCQCWDNRPVHSVCCHGYMSIMADTHRMERPSRRLLTSRAFNVSALLITNW